mmetsp:Transcript_4821/g.7261  ORF Transcript_4821/g.7261 Transcript_4821/m.7261 type:complete len:336 (-) Transcript_4821:2969-3976(-)
MQSGAIEVDPNRTTSYLPPEDLIKKTVVDVEPVKTGGPFAFIKFNRLLGQERLEEMNPVNRNRDGTMGCYGGFESEIPVATTISDYMINAKEVNRLVYCRFGEKYVTDLEKRRNSNLHSLNQPMPNLSSASYLINIKKLVEEHNIDGEKKDFKTMKTGQMGKVQSTPTQFYKPTGPDDETLIFESRFESGNLLAAIKVSEVEYDLILQNDINTNGNTQWYFFRVANKVAGKKIRFNFLNLNKSDSLYNYGMRILSYTNNLKVQQGLGWHRVGSEIMYFQNQYKRDYSRAQRCYYTLSFVHEFKTENDQSYFAHCFPYTFSDLQEDLSRIEKDSGC